MAVVAAAAVAVQHGVGPATLVYGVALVVSEAACTAATAAVAADLATMYSVDCLVQHSVAQAVASAAAAAARPTSLLFWDTTLPRHTVLASPLPATTGHSPPDGLQEKKRG
jgi:uncharacterized membrane-anchored protein